MTGLILIRGARQLVTLRGPKQPRRGILMGDLGIISDGAMLIRDGIIEDIGNSRRVERLASARHATEIDATGRVVMPAFVDAAVRVAAAHATLPQQELPVATGARQGILEGARAVKKLSQARLEARCRFFLRGMLRHGTTTVEAQTGYGIDEASELKILRAYRALNANPVEVIPTCFVSTASPDCERDPGAYVARTAIPLLEGIAQRKLARFADIRCAPDGFTPAAARTFLGAARRLGLGVKVQAHDAEPDESVALAVELAARSISHVEQISQADVGLIAGSGVIATLCPGVSWESRSGRFAPARALIEGGAAVSLASNFNAESSPIYSMPFILSLACRHLKMTGAESIVAATINAAYAAGCAHSVGSLEPRKQANLLILDSHDYREIPYFAGANPVHAVLRNGEAV